MEERPAQEQHGCWCQRPEQGPWGLVKGFARNVAAASGSFHCTDEQVSFSLPLLLPPALCWRWRLPLTPHLRAFQPQALPVPVISQTFLLETRTHTSFGCCSLSHVASGRGSPPEVSLLRLAEDP